MDASELIAFSVTLPDPEFHVLERLRGDLSRDEFLKLVMQLLATGAVSAPPEAPLLPEEQQENRP